MICQRYKILIATLQILCKFPEVRNNGSKVGDFMKPVGEI